MLRYALVFCLAAAPAFADVDEVIDHHILPGYASLSQATAALDQVAQEDCRKPNIRLAYHDAFDAWAKVAHLRFGPSESAATSIAFWPDKRGATPRILSELIATQDPSISSDYYEFSSAVRGFYALESLLYDDRYAEYETESYTCDLIRAIISDLSKQSKCLEIDWKENYAGLLRSAGDQNNTVYLSKDEAISAVYTQLVGGLEYIITQQLGRPMGSFERPRPARAEAWRSARSVRNIELSLRALQTLAEALADHDTPNVDAAFQRAIAEIRRPADPGFQDVIDPSARLRMESLQNRIQEVVTAVEQDIGKPLNVTTGFNSLDGD